MTGTPPLTFWVSPVRYTGVLSARLSLKEKLRINSTASKFASTCCTWSRSGASPPTPTHYGFLSNRVRKQSLSEARRLLGAVERSADSTVDESAECIPIAVTDGSSYERCPNCEQGWMLLVERLEPQRGDFIPWRPDVWDTS